MIFLSECCTLHSTFKNIYTVKYMKDILATMHKDLILNENDQFSAFWAGPLTIIPPRDETSEEVAFAFLTDHCWQATCPRSVEAELNLRPSSSRQRTYRYTTASHLLNMSRKFSQWSRNTLSENAARLGIQNLFTGKRTNLKCRAHRANPMERNCNGRSDN